MSSPSISSLLDLWANLSKAHDGGAHNDRALAVEAARAIPGAGLCALYSRPMDVLEHYAVRVGDVVVGRGGAWPADVYPLKVREAGLVPAPCRLREKRLDAER